ncbi:MAG: Bifunctional PGK/TIM [Myxococcota bacterium]|nr:Bifunctional PGK/TIM [Myxococcota bacterium]
MKPSTRKPLIAGNWKMYKTPAESRALARGVADGARGLGAVELAVAPVFVSIGAVADALAGSAIGVAAQNCHWETQGAFTGEVSAPMLRAAGCSMVIIGHSERRQYFAETNSGVNRKTKAALAAGLVPIVCIGETLAERDAGKTLDIVLGQLREGLDGVAGDAGVVIAYEPVWAIGTGRNAAPTQAQEVHAAIRNELSRIWGAAPADAARILYGGSVKPDNARELLSQTDVDGALVGGASLTADSFLAIANAAQSLAA